MDDNGSVSKNILHIVISTCLETTMYKHCACPWLYCRLQQPGGKAVYFTEFFAIKFLFVIELAAVLKLEWIHCYLHHHTGQRQLSKVETVSRDRLRLAN